jgi:hypothetical protein
MNFELDPELERIQKLAREGKLDLRHMKAGLTKLLVSRVPGFRRD